ncbi:hypothetical protein BSK60_15625 [Paenibacillus odorifer]|nr:hypothetical protein BSK60_15625 [Paenibacillus odorifer]
MWLKERPFLGSPGGFACGAFTARAVRPAAQGRAMAPRAIAALTGSRLGSQGKSGATSCARSRMAPRAIAALRDRGSGARKEAAAAAQDCPKIEKSFID